MNTNLNLVKAWNTLWSQLTSWAPGLGVILAVIGIAVVAVALSVWLYQKRKGGGKPFPIAAIVVGLVLAGPSVVIPIFLSIIQVLFVVLANAIGWFVNTIA